MFSQLKMTSYLQTKLSHHLRKKPNNCLFFNFKRNILGKALFKFRVFLFFYQFQITLFCFNFHMSSFQACAFARVYVPLYIKAANKCPPIQTCVFSLRDDSVLLKSVQEGTQLLMLPRILVQVPSVEHFTYQNLPGEWRRREQDTFLSLIMAISQMQVSEAQTTPQFCHWL